MNIWKLNKFSYKRKASLSFSGLMTILKRANIIIAWQREWRFRRYCCIYGVFSFILWVLNPREIWIFHALLAFRLFLRSSSSFHSQEWSSNGENKKMNFFWLIFLLSFHSFCLIFFSSIRCTRERKKLFLCISHSNYNLLLRDLLQLFYAIFFTQLTFEPQLKTEEFREYGNAKNSTL